jgi:hypothetical protein
MQTFRGGRRDQSKDFVIRNLREGTPWFNAIERQNRARHTSAFVIPPPPPHFLIDAALRRTKELPDISSLSKNPYFVPLYHS